VRSEIGLHTYLKLITSVISRRQAIFWICVALAKIHDDNRMPRIGLRGAVCLPHHQQREVISSVDIQSDPEDNRA
jgi:hypothetical protein